jgi:hypothetical protein
MGRTFEPRSCSSINEEDVSILFTVEDDHVTVLVIMKKYGMSLIGSIESKSGTMSLSKH